MFKKMSPKPEQINNEQKLFKNLSKKQIIFLLLIVLAFVGLGGLAVVKASDNPAFCSTTCHNMKPQYNSYQNSSSNLLAYKHAKAKIVCHDCHQDSLTTKAQEGVKYVTGNYEDPMKTRTFSKEMCLKCHDWKKVQKRPHRLEQRQMRIRIIQNTVVSGSVVPATKYMSNQPMDV